MVWFARTAKRFLARRDGHIAMMTAIIILPLLIGVGMSIDFVRTLEIKARLAHAADAAVLASLSSASQIEALVASQGEGVIPAAGEDATNFFMANVIGSALPHVTDVAAEVRRTNKEITSVLTYQASVGTVFGRLVNIHYWPISGKAAATVNIEAAIDFYLLLDNTPSMGLGATTSDIDTMIANTPDKCAFACHALNNNDNYYNLARNLGIDLRIDVVRKATQNLMDTAKDIRTYPSQYRMSVHTFGEAATSMGLTQISPLTSNLDQVKTAAEAIDLMTIPYQNYDNDQQTDFDGTLTALNAIVPNPGTGLKGDEPQKVVFFVSDGVADAYKPYGCTKKIQGTGRCMEPIDIKSCKAIKDRGIKIAVLYTTYLPLPSNNWYNTWIKPFHPEISTRMEACASPGLFFEVSPSEGISEALDALFLKTISVLRLVV